MRRLFFVRFPEKCYCIRQGEFFQFFLILMDTVNIKSKICTLLHDANIEITIEKLSLIHI